MIQIDLLKAKDITKDMLRAERVPLMQALDVEIINNLSDKTKLAEIEQEKRRLRDITKIVDDLTTVDQLKGVNCGW